MFSSPITLKDGTIIYSEDTLKDYLSSLGFDDLDDLTYILFPEKEEFDAGGYISRDKVDDYEHLYSELDYEIRSVYNEIEELCDKFTATKKGTKAEFARQVKKTIFEGIGTL